MRFQSILIFVASAAASVASGNTIKVPTDQPTIQAGINAASNGDTVLVAPGTYTENISFIGKAITVTSTKGSAVTTIDGGRIAPVVTFTNGEGRKSVLSRFTLRNGTSTAETYYSGGGVFVNGTSPTIANNVIQNNSACNSGGGIGVSDGSPIIKNNTITGNFQSSCVGGPGGGGIAVLGYGKAKIIGNKIENNSWPFDNGGGIALDGAGTPTIMNNIISNNSSPEGGQGGGLSMVNASNALVVQNLFYGNTAFLGGAIYISVPYGNVGPVLVNNTFVGGSGVSEGSAAWVGGFDNQVRFFNNLMIGLTGQNAVYCDDTFSPQPPTFTNNDSYSPNGTGLEGTCTNEGSGNGNISRDPLFVNPSSNNYQLQSGSPAINAGDRSAPRLPKKDLAGKPRIVNGAVDIGAYESQ